MAPNSSGKASSDRANSSATTSSGTARCARLPDRRAPRAGLEVAEAELAHDASVCAGAPAAPGRRRAGRTRTTADSRSVKMVRQVGDERLECRAHLIILRARRNPVSRVESRAMRFREIQRRLLRRRHGLPSLLGGLKRNPWLRVHAIVTMFDSGGSSGPAARRAGRAAAGRRAQVRAGAVAQRRRGAARPAGAAADARAREALRPHRRQPAALDDGAVQRRLPRGGRRAAHAARLRGPRLAGQRRPAPRSAPSTPTASITRGEVEVDAGADRGHMASQRVWLEPPRDDSPGGRRGDRAASTP